MSRVLVTGAGSGIGRAIARAFAAEGHAVTVAGRRRAPLDETAQGHPMTCRTADVTDEAQVAALFDTPFDVVVANAGGAGSAKLEAVTLSDWQETLAVNLTGTFLTFRAALRAGMAPGGRLIALASVAGLKGSAGIAPYVAAKHGVVGLVRSVAIEVAKRGITCNAICPGYVDTPLANQAAAAISARLGIPDQEARRRLAAANPTGRLITAEEVAAVALFLASPAAGQVKGHALSVSGGEA
ncbi:MAG TPA: SDR family NAD(P)-dependent oxidoreductase [Paracoccaceae bacterium]|nr:SDR family NAD(P)-dependent oxidoreductase [Paracoccaceae bacterium]